VHLAKIYKQSGNAKTEEAYRNAENRCRTLVRNFEQNVENEIARNDNIESFNKFLNKRMSSRQGIGTPKNRSGEYVPGNVDRANLLKRFFWSVCTADNGVIPAIDSVVGDDVAPDRAEFTRDAAQRAIKKLKSNSARGPDGLPPLLFKNLTQCSAEPLAFIFSSFIFVGGVPDE
jgi:hypothetical protein